MQTGMWLIIGFNLLLTAVWVRMMWTHSHPSQEGDFDQWMSQGFRTFLVGIVTLSLWIGFLVGWLNRG